jgi:adenosylcobinamide-GDP ribazoletransferase
VGIVHAAAGALAFLTVVPMRRFDLREGDVARGVVFFPLVGALVGVTVALVSLGLEGVVMPLLAAVIAVACEAGATGAIHLDGLADTADGLGGPTRERALEIMREGVIGAFGAGALVLGLLLKTGAIAVLLAEGDTVLTLAAAFALGRAAPLATALVLPYARLEAGSGRILTETSSPLLLGGGLVVAGVLAAAFVGLDAVPLAGGALAGTLVVGVLAWWRFGGLTGDVLGATIELATMGSLLAAAAVS